jgi:hypothetical protein
MNHFDDWWDSLDEGGGGGVRTAQVIYLHRTQQHRNHHNHAVSRIRTHDLSFQAMKAFASDLEQPHYVF